MQNQKLENRMRQNGLKCTRQRLAILRVLVDRAQPMTVEDVFSQLKELKIDMNMSTVYRSMEAMCAANVLQRVTLSGDNRMAYIFEQTPHHHYLVCSQCKRILPIESCPLGAFEKTLAAETGFVIQGHRLDLYGLCPDCQAASVGQTNG